MSYVLTSTYVHLRVLTFLNHGGLTLDHLTDAQTAHTRKRYIITPTKSFRYNFGSMADFEVRPDSVIMAADTTEAPKSWIGPIKLM